MGDFRNAINIRLPQCTLALLMNHSLVKPETLHVESWSGYWAVSNVCCNTPGTEACSQFIVGKAIVKSLMTKVMPHLEHEVAVLRLVYGVSYMFSKM